MLTPEKRVKGQMDKIKQRDKTANDLFSTAVFKVKQPIESLFNWLTEKRSSKSVRSEINKRIDDVYIWQFSCNLHFHYFQSIIGINNKKV